MSENKLYKVEHIGKINEYFKILLKFAKLKPEESLKLKDREFEILSNNEVKNGVLSSITSVVLSSGTENKNFENIPDGLKQEFLDKFHDIDYKGENYTENQKLEIIRNSLAHSNFDIINHNGEDILYIDNKRMSGFQNFEEFYGEFSFIYLSLMKEVIGSSKEHTRTDYFGDRSKLDSIENLTKENLRDYLNSVKKITYSGNRELLDNKSIVYKRIINSSGQANKKTFEITKLINEKIDEIPHKYRDISKKLKEFEITNLSYKEIDHVLKYIEYMGYDKFNKLSISEKTNIFNTVICAYNTNRKEFESEVLVNNIFAIDNLVKNGKREISNDDISKATTPFKEKAKCADALTRKYIDGLKINQEYKEEFKILNSINDIDNIIKTDFKCPIDYEMIMRAYSFYMLTYMRELINTNCIDEEILNYAKIDTSEFKAEYRYKKSEITEKKHSLQNKIPNLNIEFEACDNKIEAAKKKKVKFDNPKNPKRDEIIAEQDKIIAQKEKRKLEIRKEIDDAQRELDYIIVNKKILPNNNDFFRGMRNSNAHGNITSYYDKFFKSSNLDDIEFYFQDIHDGRTSFNLLTSASNLIRLYDRIALEVEKNISGKEIGKPKEPNFEKYDKDKQDISDILKKFEEPVNENCLQKNILNQEMKNKENEHVNIKDLFTYVKEGLKKGVSIFNIKKSRINKANINKTDKIEGEDIKDEGR